jgi:hypothetical protein
MMSRSVPVVLLLLCVFSLAAVAQTPQNPSATNSGSMSTNTAGSATNNPSTAGTGTTSASSPVAGSTVGSSSGSNAAPEAASPSAAPTGVSTPTTASPGAVSAPSGSTAATSNTAQPKPAPSTTIYADTSRATAPERRVAGDPLNPPPLPDTKATLVGGIVEGVDRIRNRITIRPFGGNKMKLVYDERTRFYRNGVETTFAGVKKGDRIYVDTQLDGATVFARNVRVRNEQEAADARGQVMRVEGGRIGVKDDLSGQTVTFVADGNTRIVKGGQSATLADVKEGSLVNVKFRPDRADRGAAEEISLVAAPGDTFTFAGRITHLDMAHGVMAVQNQTDNRNYEISFDPNSDGHDSLGVGEEVTVTAMFDGTRYMAKSLNVNRTAENRQ